MILSENVSVKVCHQNYKYYEDKGYQVTKELDKRNRITVPTQYITVKWTDIPHKSNQKIELKCDICGKKFERKIRYYYLSHENNNIDACSKKCQSVKSMETKIDKYGTVNPAEIAIQIDGNIGRPEKYNIESLKRLCNEKGYQLYEDSLKDCKKITLKTIVTILCLKHNITFQTSVMSLDNKDSCNCPDCLHEKLVSMNNKSSIEEVKEICKEKDYELLTTSIDNCDSKVKYICNKHKDYGIQSTSLYGLKHSKTNCKMCRMPKNESHWNWAGGIASERDKIKNTSQYKQWVQDVFERDNYTCQCCGNSGVYLEAHHLYNFSEYPDLRMDINNGITLCHNCHSIAVPGSFHRVYTQFHNTPEQLEEYINNYKKNHQESQSHDSLLLCSNL